MITLGKVMFILGILGVVLSGGCFCFLPKLFRKQREKLLDELKSDR